MLAFFNTLPEKGLDGNWGNAKPYLKLPTTGSGSPVGRREAWHRCSRKGPGRRSDRPVDQSLGTDGADSARAARLTVGALQFDGNLGDSSGAYRYAHLAKGDITYGNGPVGRALIVDQLSQINFNGIPPLDRDLPFSVSFWMSVGSNRGPGVLARVEDAESRRGIELLMDRSAVLGRLKEGSHLVFRMSHAWPADAIEVRTKDRIVQGDWYQVAVSYDGTGGSRGIHVYLNGEARGNGSGTRLVDGLGRHRQALALG